MAIIIVITVITD